MRTEGVEPSMGQARRFLRPVRLPRFRHVRKGAAQAAPQFTRPDADAAAPAADARDRACRRASSCTTFAGRGACFGRDATRTRCRCISLSFLCWGWRPTAPATSRAAGIRTQTSGVGARRAAVALRPFDTSRWLESRPRRFCLRAAGALPIWRSHVGRTSGLCRRRTALSPAERRAYEGASGRSRTPHVGPYKGHVLAVDTTEARWRRQDSNLLPLGASEVLFLLSYVPEVRRVESKAGRDGVAFARPVPYLARNVRAEPPQHRGDRVTDCRARRCSASARGVAGRVRTGPCRAHNPGCFRLHHGHHGAGTTGSKAGRDGLAVARPVPCLTRHRRVGRTGGLSPEERALCSSELRPRSSAGGIRTHDLELMRLARTASPLPRKVWPAGVEPAISGARSRWVPTPLRPADRYSRPESNRQLPG
jgi:hypothetical protein